MKNIRTTEEIINEIMVKYNYTRTEACYHYCNTECAPNDGECCCYCEVDKMIRTNGKRGQNYEKC